jgi:quercetin dioxygenase-like cupin family protein
VARVGIKERVNRLNYLKRGDVVNIPPNVKHWHGATKDGWFVHLAMTPGETEWIEPVDDETYNKL